MHTSFLGEKSEVFVKQFWNHLKLAGMYYAYSGIHKFTVSILKICMNNRHKVYVFNVYLRRN